MDKGYDLNHHFHANASAFGGQLDAPANVTVPALAATSLPSVGGTVEAQHDDFEQVGKISIKKAYTKLSGKVLRDGSFETTVIAVIEDLNIVDLLFAKKIALKITTIHPVTGHHPTVSFKGSRFVGLRTTDCTFTPKLNTDPFTLSPGEVLHPRGWLYNPKLRKFAQEQSKSLAASAKQIAAMKIPVFERLQKRHSGGGPNSHTSIAARGNIKCSVVQDIQWKGKCEGGASVGHTLYIPDFGRVFLGELIIDGTSFNLNMLRVDMGSTTRGTGSGPQGGANGTNTGGA